MEACSYCGRVAKLTKDLCHAHYQRWLRAGRPATGVPPSKRPQRPPVELTAPKPKRRVASAEIRQCAHCRCRIPSGTLCGRCASYQRHHGVPRPLVKRWALHTDRPDCICRTCCIKRSYATGRRVAPRRQPALTDWAPEEDALVLRLAGTMPLAHIPARLNAECQGARSVWAVRDRIYHLGASPQVAAYSVADLVRAFGVGSRVIARWIQAGWLTAERVEDRPGRQWYIYEASVDRFIRERAGVYYWPGIRVRRWRNLAEVVARRYPWVPLVDMAARLGLAATTLHRWMQLGRLPAVWQNGAGCRVRRWMVDANVATDLARARTPQNALETAS